MGLAVSLVCIRAKTRSMATWDPPAGVVFGKVFFFFLNLSWNKTTDFVFEQNIFNPFRLASTKKTETIHWVAPANLIQLANIWPRMNNVAMEKSSLWRIRLVSTQMTTFGWCLTRMALLRVNPVTWKPNTKTRSFRRRVFPMLWTGVFPYQTNPGNICLSVESSNAIPFCVFLFFWPVFESRFIFTINSCIETC